MGARRPLLSAGEGSRQGDNQGTPAVDKDILTCGCPGGASQDVQTRDSQAPDGCLTLFLLLTEAVILGFEVREFVVQTLS